MLSNKHQIHALTICITLLMLISCPLLSQSLFENALELPNDSAGNSGYELNGFIKGALFTGRCVSEQNWETKRFDGETALKLSQRKSNKGRAYAELRFSRNAANGFSNCDLREAHVTTSWKAWDAAIGQQIIVWGKADGYCPTNKITPIDLTVFSSDEDDRRMSSGLLKISGNWQTTGLELIYIPVYKPSILPIEKASLPGQIHWGVPDLPNACIPNSTIAFKIKYEGASMDGSVSAMHGFMPMPGLAASYSASGLELLITPFQAMQFGADFSSTLGNFGLRGECACMLPRTKKNFWGTTPNSQAELIIGMDRELGHFSLIVQFMTRHVFDFQPLTQTESPLQHELKSWNRMITGQQNAWTHAISFRPSWSLMHQLLDIELPGQYNTTTQEVYLKPKLSYALSDAFSLTAGAQIYHGPGNTLYGKIEDAVSAFFIESKLSF